MLLSRVLAVALLVFSSAAFAGSVNFNMSNTAAQLEVGSSSDGNSEIQTGFIYNDKGSALVDTGLIVKGGGGEQDASGLAAGGGVKAMAGRIQQGIITSTVSCIVLGGQGVYTFPAAPAIAVAGEFFTALKITSYGDMDRYNQFAARLEMGPPHAKFFIGYREITFSIKGTGSVSFDHGGYTGVMFSF